jgi:hypothetical protein
MESTVAEQLDTIIALVKICLGLGFICYMCLRKALE